MVLSLHCRIPCHYLHGYVQRPQPSDFGWNFLCKQIIVSSLTILFLILRGAEVILPSLPSVIERSRNDRWTEAEVTNLATSRCLFKTCLPFFFRRSAACCC